MPGVRVECAYHQFFYTGIDDGIRAGAGSPSRGAGFERDVKSGTRRYLPTESRKTFNLGVRCAGAPVMTPRHDLAVEHEHGADSGIGTR